MLTLQGEGGIEWGDEAAADVEIEVLDDTTKEPESSGKLSTYWTLVGFNMLLHEVLY